MSMTVESVIAELRGVASNDLTPPAAQTWLAEVADRLDTWLAGVNDPRVPPALDERLVKGAALPSTIGAMADLYAEVRERRLSDEKAVAEIKSRETEIHNVILSALSESSDTGASGKTCRVQLVNKTRQHVKDWPTLHAFIREHNLFDLLQRRLSDTAAKEFVEAYKQPLPGVEDAEVPTLSFHKI